MSLLDAPYTLRLLLMSAGPRGVLRYRDGWEVVQADQAAPGETVYTQADLLAEGADAVTPEVPAA